MRKLGIEEIKSIQLDILKNIHSFCLANQLHYSLAYGSLLGAVRHKGYIPWDDDIDIMMPRKDYDKFVASFGNDRFHVIERALDRSYYIPFAKVYDAGTEVIEKTDLPQSGFGVYVDVFPLDNIPDKDCDFKRMMWKKHFLNCVYILKAVKIRKRSMWWKNLVLLLSKLFLLPVSFSCIVNIMEKLCLRNNATITQRVGLISPTDSNPREIWNVSIFKKYIMLPFEDSEFSCVADYDIVLRSMYGDYMKLPPEEKRVTHHCNEAYMK